MIYGYGYEPQSPTYADLTQYNSSSLEIENKTSDEIENKTSDKIENKTSDAIGILELTDENRKRVRFLESDPFDPELWFKLFDYKDEHDRYFDNARRVLEPGYLWVHEKDKNIIFWTIPSIFPKCPELALIHRAQLSKDRDKLFAYSFYGRVSYGNKETTPEELKIEIQWYLSPKEDQ